MIPRTVIVNSNCHHGFSIEEAVRGAVKAGFRNIELTATKGWTEHVFPTMSFARLCDVRDMVRSNGLDIVAMSGHTNLMDISRLDDFKMNMRLASFLGARIIVTSVGEAHLEDKAKGADEQVAKNIRGLLPLADDLGLSIVLETHGEHGTASRIRPIIELTGSPLVRICYDTANAVFYGDVKGAEDVEANADLIGYVHVKDKAAGRTDWDFPALGQGWLDIPAVLKALDEAGNKAPLSVEIEFTKDGPSGLQEVDDALITSARYLEGLGYTL